MRRWPCILMEAGLQTWTIASTSSSSPGMIRPVNVQQMRTHTLRSIAGQNALRSCSSRLVPQQAVKKGPFPCILRVLD